MYHCLTFIKKCLESKQYPNFVEHAKTMASIFGSTYASEHDETDQDQAQPTDEHLQDVMLLSSSTYHLNFKAFK